MGLGICMGWKYLKRDYVFPENDPESTKMFSLSVFAGVSQKESESNHPQWNPNLLHIFCPDPLSQLTIIHLSLYFHISEAYFHISEQYFHISEITNVHSLFYFRIQNDMTCEFKK